MSFKQFSTLLVQDGVVPIHKVEEAFQRQILFGGRLGTNLLEIGALDEATLLRYLAKASEIPFAGRSLLRKREARARAALSADKVRLERALPIAFHDEVLLLLVTDPLDAGKVQELELAAGCRVEQRITNELRFDALMHELYGDPLEKRTEQLLQRFPLSQAPDDERDEDDGWGELEKQALADWDISSPPAAASTPEPIPPAAAIINPRRRSRAESGALSYDDFLKVLEGNASRDELYRAFSRFCLSLARRCAVFAVLDERLRCLVLDGPSGVDAKDLVISVRAQSDLAEVCRGHSYYQGPSVDTELGSFYERIGVTAPAEVVAVPIKFSERVGAVGVLDNLDAALHTELNQLFKAVYKLGEALEKLIRERQEHGFRELFSGSPRNRQRESGHRHEAKSPSPVLGQALSPKEMLAELEPESIERSESARQGVADEELLDGEVLELEPEPLELEAQDAEERLTELELLEMDEDQVEAAKAFLQAPPQTLAEIDVVAVESEPGFRLAPKTLAEVDIIAVDAEPGFRAAPKTLAEVDIIAVDADFEEQAKGGFASVPHAPAFTAPEQLDFIDSELEILSHDDDELDAVELEPLPLEAEPEEIDELEHPESDLDFWVVKLDSHDAEVAAKAHRLLSRSAPEHLEALLKRFPGRLRLDRFHFDKEMPVAIQHSRLLGCLVLHGLDAVSALLSLLEGPSVEERFYALLVLGEIRVEGLPRRIWRRIYDKDAQIRRHCAQILRTRVRDASWPEVLELIIDGAQQADDRHAELSLNALAIVRDFKAMGAIIPLVEHGNRRVAEAALQAAMGTALTDLGASAKRWERWLDENRNSNRMQLIAEAMVHKERHIRALAAEEIAEIPGIMLNYHPDAHRREQAKAREVFLEWNSNHDGGFRSHLGSGLGRTLRGGRERE